MGIVRPHEGYRDMMKNSTAKVGYWAALGTLVFSITYAIPQIVLGIEMPDTLLWLWIILFPSLLLAPAFLIQMVAVHNRTPVHLRIWTHVAVVFATAYFVFVSIVYFINLTVVAPRMAAGDLGELEVLRYAPRTFMTGIDALGYTSMSLATLFAAPAFESVKGERWIKRLFLINGALAPIILATQVWPNLAYAATPWLVTVPGSSLLLALLFRRESRTDQNAAA